MNETYNKKHIQTIILTIILGMSITLVRCVMPLSVEITIGVVILETILELGICSIIIWLNRKELKEIFLQKITKNDIENIFYYAIIIFFGGIIITNVVIENIYLFITGKSFIEQISNASAAVVGNEFQRVFLLGPIITMCITAPIFEEIVFRMTFKKIFNNIILYILISSFFFAFMHTVNISLELVDYFISGCLFAIVYIKSKDIRICIGAHMMHNIMLFIFLLINWITSLF